MGRCSRCRSSRRAPRTIRRSTPQPVRRSRPRLRPHAPPTAVPPCGLGVPDPYQPVRLVGYGASTHTGQGAGVKRQVTTNINGMNDIIFNAGGSNAQACRGDWGGPAPRPSMAKASSAPRQLGDSYSPGEQCCGSYLQPRDWYAAYINANTHGSVRRPAQSPCALRRGAPRGQNRRTSRRRAPAAARSRRYSRANAPARVSLRR